MPPWLGHQNVVYLNDEEIVVLKRGEGDADL